MCIPLTLTPEQGRERERGRAIEIRVHLLAADSEPAPKNLVARQEKDPGKKLGRKLWIAREKKNSRFTKAAKLTRKLSTLKTADFDRFHDFEPWPYQSWRKVSLRRNGIAKGSKIVNRKIT
ncbi:hypothetical protein A2U01_0014123 [Trifolium medium]|uniref:Uncharacterized protein n=1 Tax=Trifolium medium TaxID=97028 RepID=A0A392N1Z2_9FABA|nr:hypothetical protein [Trifolium medium]